MRAPRSLHTLASHVVPSSVICPAFARLCCPYDSKQLVTETDVRHGDDPVQHVVGRVSLECAINVGLTFGEGMPDRVILQSLHTRTTDFSVTSVALVNAILRMSRNRNQSTLAAWPLLLYRVTKLGSGKSVCVCVCAS